MRFVLFSEVTLGSNIGKVIRQIAITAIIAKIAITEKSSHISLCTGCDYFLKILAILAVMAILAIQLSGSPCFGFEFFPGGNLGGGQACRENSIGRAGNVVQTHLVAKLH